MPGSSISISVVTAVRNMEATVGATVNSVVNQKRNNDQYIFIDGASTDKTLEIARSFKDKIDYFISEPDAGQYHAIAKGFAQASGDVFAWINADDILMPWTFSVVSEIFERFPQVDWITGTPSFLSENGQLTRVEFKPGAYPRRFIANGWFRSNLGGFLQQESMFWRRSLWEKVGGLNLSLSLAADFDLWMRFAQHADLVPVDVPLGAFRLQPGRQRSSVHELKYLSEVAMLCYEKEAPNRLWRILSEKGSTAASIARLLISEKHPIITFDSPARRWEMVSRRRSIARLSLDQILDRRLLKQRRRQ